MILPVYALALSLVPRVSAEHYDGACETCHPFLTNYLLLFALQLHTLAMEEEKVAFVINHLTGRAWLWGTAKWVRRSSACASFDQFTAELCEVFGFKSCGAEAASGLIGLRRTENKE